MDKPQTTLPICGINGFMGCGEQIERIAELYRCTDCGIAFHKPCILSHFNGAHHPHPLRETQLMEGLAAKEKELLNAQMMVSRILEAAK